MKLFVVPNGGNKFVVQDANERKIYSVKKKTFGSKFVLYDASDYELYVLEQITNDKKPLFRIILNDRLFLSAKCLSVFLDPGFEIESKTMKFALKSKDRKAFVMEKNGKEIGKLETVRMLSGDLQYEIEIEDIEFDDYIPLFAIMVERAFGDINKSK